MIYEGQVPIGNNSQVFLTLSLLESHGTFFSMICFPFHVVVSLGIWGFLASGYNICRDETATGWWWVLSGHFCWLQQMRLSRWPLSSLLVKMRSIRLDFWPVLWRLHSCWCWVRKASFVACRNLLAGCWSLWLHFTFFQSVSGWLKSPIKRMWDCFALPMLAIRELISLSFSGVLLGLLYNRPSNSVSLSFNWHSTRMASSVLVWVVVQRDGRILSLTYRQMPRPGLSRLWKSS